MFLEKMNILKKRMAEESVSEMYIFLLIGMLSIWYVGRGKKVAQIAEKDVFFEKRHGTEDGWLKPYHRGREKGERLAEIVQAAAVAIISGMSAMKISAPIEKAVIFCVTFIVCTWLIKLMAAGVDWLQTYIRLLTLDGIFAILTPIIILWHMPRMCSLLEIRLTFLALILSTFIVYGEIIHIVVGKEFHINKAVQIKSILTWLVIILMNLYTLLVFVQFYMNVKAHHFIAAEHLTKKAMIDLFYYLIVTFTTVGFGDIRPSTSLAKIITCIIAISGMLFTGMFMGAVLGSDEKRKDK